MVSSILNVTSVLKYVEYTIYLNSILHVHLYRMNQLRVIQAKKVLNVLPP